MKPPTHLFSLCAVAAMVAGCDMETRPASPQQYEQAKSDCAPHGGLVSVESVVVMLRPDRVDATCHDGLRLSRKA